MKYLLRRNASSLYILCDFTNEVSGTYQSSVDSALYTDLSPMGDYWSTARHFDSQDALETHLSRYYTIIERITDKPTEPQTYEYW